MNKIKPMAHNTGRDRHSKVEYILPALFIENGIEIVFG